MKIGIIGSGMVGRAFALRLSALGHDVVVGTRDVQATLKRTEPDNKGIPAWQFWAAEHPEIRLVPFPEAGRISEVIINATEGNNSLNALSQVSKDNLDGKIILDLALPLSYSPDRPPHLTYANDDSLGERLQREFPGSHIVKTFNTMTHTIMLDPALLPAPHTVFISGESDTAKSTITQLLEQFGWPREDIMDLGGIISSRGTEMYANLLFYIAQVTGSYDFNISVIMKK
jgi:predicted dinucleotide-binding enzyme